MPHALIGPGDLSAGRKGPLAKVFAKVAMRLLSIDRVNRLYCETYDSGKDCAAHLLRLLGTTWSACEKDISNIPREGAAVFVSNHPSGALDGVLLIDLLTRLRPDIKIMGNFLLNRIDSLSEFFIPVDPFDNTDKQLNIRGVRQAMEHVASGGALLIFPAGEVATWQKGFGQLRDKPWQVPALKFIRKTAAPIIPVRIEARNSLLFHLAGKVHPGLRTALLPREFANKRGLTVNVSIGSPIIPKITESLGDISSYGSYLRASVEFLRRKDDKILPAAQSAIKSGVQPESIAPPLPLERLLKELDGIRSESLLFAHSGFEVHCAKADQIPCMLYEIGRLREETFRAVGEGTLRRVDTDHYDSYYHHLFLWDGTNGRMAGAYRIGMGSEIMSRYGLSGFYITSLFRMGKQMEPVMEKTMELGRSFIVGQYQRKPVPLMLLWKGILHWLLIHPDYRNLTGPVSVPGTFDLNSKTLIMKYLLKHHYNAELGTFIRPVNGTKGIDAPLDGRLIEDISQPELINKIVSDIERVTAAMPVLLRKYILLNSSVLGFNVDPAFNNCLDALMLLDLKRIPEHTITMLSKEMTDIDVLGRFRGYSK